MATLNLLPDSWALDDAILQGNQALRASAQACNSQIGELRGQVASHQAAVQAAQATAADAAELSSLAVVKAGVGTKIQVLQAALRFRKTAWANFLDAAEDALEEAVAAAGAVWRAAEVSARESLVTSGWLDADIRPAFLSTHPSVSKAAAAYAALSDQLMGDIRSRRAENADAAAAIADELAEVKQSHLRAVTVETVLRERPRGNPHQ